MPHHPSIDVSGVVTHVFAHRFVLDTEGGAMLGDLTPHGAARVELAVGDRVRIHGERKPSEVKVLTIERNGAVVHIGVHDKHDAADAAVALRAATDAGYTTVGTPRRKPKHFEVLVRRGSRHEELHVELAGTIRKSKLADPNEPKWKEHGSA